MAQRFTTDEDAIIMSYAKEAEDEGTPYMIAFIRPADEMGKTVKSLVNRHRRLVKILKNKENDTMSEAEKIVLRLKALNRERERNAEKSDLYKEKFDALKEEHEKLKMAHRKLQLEHQTLVNTVKNVLGDDLNLGGEYNEVS